MKSWISSLLLIAFVELPIAASGEQATVLVVGATPSGVAAAVAAARSGVDVTLIEESDHVGGVLTGGLTNTDIRKDGAVGGLYNEFKRRIVEHYVKTFGANSEAVKLCNDGNMFEPKAAEQVFRDMLAAEKNIHLLVRHRLVGARVMTVGKERDAVPGKRVDGGVAPKTDGTVKLVSIAVLDLNVPNRQIELRAGSFIDATYEGDLAAMAGVPYRVGRESRAAYGEAHAGKIYVRFGDRSPLPGSTGEADDGIQAFCFRFHLTKDKANLVPVEKPAGFNRDDYRHLIAQLSEGKVTKFSQVVQLYPMPGGNFEVNSDHPNPDTGVPAQSLDLAEENYRWPEASADERDRMFARYWAYNEGLIWLLQHDDSVPETVRTEASQWGFPKNEFVDHNHRPHQIYVRQGRRVWGEYTLTENDAKTEHGSGLPRHKADAIAVAEYPFDCHAVGHYDPAHPMLRPGYFYVDHEPLQLPYRMVVPLGVDGLLVPVACSASHVGYQTVRMEPVFMALGEACGIAVAQSQANGVEVRAAPVQELQREILRRGGVILYESVALRPQGL